MNPMQHTKNVGSAQFFNSMIYSTQSLQRRTAECVNLYPSRCPRADFKRVPTWRRSIDGEMTVSVDGNPVLWRVHTFVR